MLYVCPFPDIKDTEVLDQCLFDFVLMVFAIWVVTDIDSELVLQQRNCSFQFGEASADGFGDKQCK